jgi:hypothetical protein
MNMKHTDRYWASSLFLICASGICALIIILTDRRDLTSASVILGAIILFLTGVLLIPFSRETFIDGKFASLLQVQNSITLCRVATDLGIQGSAYIIPRPKDEQQFCIQLMPVSMYSGGTLEGDSFVIGTGGVGILVPPSCLELFQELKSRHNLLIPNEREEFSTLFRDIAVEVLDISNEIKVVWTESGVNIKIEEYQLIEGCRRITRESPACCTMNPCVICSLFASCIAEGLNLPVRIERCVPVPDKRDVDMIFSIQNESSDDS